MNPLQIEVIKQLVALHNDLLNTLLPVELERRITVNPSTITIGYQGRIYSLSNYTFIFDLITSKIKALPARSPYS